VDSEQLAMSPLVVAYNAGVQAFARKDWVEAASKLEEAITLITDPKDIGKAAPIYYTLGAAYFNAANYPKAIEVFTHYLTSYPNADRVAEVRLALARATFLNKDYEGAAKLFAQLETNPALREQSLLTQAAC